MTGGSVDWVYDATNIPYAFAMELPPKRVRHGGGYIYPKEQIVSVGEEVMAFHVSIAQQIIREFA